MVNMNLLEVLTPTSIYQQAKAKAKAKAKATSPTASTVWLARVRELRGYLWGGFMVGGFTLGGGAVGGLGGNHCGTMGSTLGGAWR